MISILRADSRQLVKRLQKNSKPQNDYVRRYHRHNHVQIHPKPVHDDSHVNAAKNQQYNSYYGASDRAVDIGEAYDLAHLYEYDDEMDVTWLTNLVALQSHGPYSGLDQGTRTKIEANLVAAGQPLKGQDLENYWLHSQWYKALGRPRIALFILGPSASGKSYVSSRKFGEAGIPIIPRTNDPDAVYIDGDIARESHTKAQAFIKALSERNLGLADLYETKTKAWSAAAKDALIDKVIKAGKHAIIPHTAMRVAKVKGIVDMFKNSGYEIHFMVVYSTFPKTCPKGVKRGEASGKAYNPTQYGISLKHAVEIIKYYHAEPKAIIYYNHYGDEVTSLEENKKTFAEFETAIGNYDERTGEGLLKEWAEERKTCAGAYTPPRI